MAVVAADIKIHLAASHATTDAAGQGGAIDPLGRMLDAQFAAAGVPSVTSSAAGDTQNCTIVGRLADGTINSEMLALTGTTPKNFTSIERILSITLASGAVGTITVKEGIGGTTRHTFAIAETDARILFYGATANAVGGGNATRYEKIFVFNDHATLAALGMTLEITTNPRDDYLMDLEGSVDDNNSTANRLTAPAGGDMQGAPTWAEGPLTVVGDDLAAQSGQGLWVQCILAEATAPTLDVIVITSSFSST